MFFNTFCCVQCMLPDTLVLRCMMFIFCVKAAVLAKRAFVACFASLSEYYTMYWIKPGWPLYYTRSTGAGKSRCCAVVVGPSSRGADYLAIEYERDGKTITHDYASLEKIHFDIRSPSLPSPSPSPAPTSPYRRHHLHPRKQPLNRNPCYGSSCDEDSDSDSDSDPESDY